MLAAIVLFACAMQTISGFGFALLAVPLMVTVTDARTASMVATALGILPQMVQSVRFRQFIQWPLVKHLSLSAFFGMPFGLLLFKFADERALRMTLGVSTLIMAVLLAGGLTLSHRGRGVDWAFGSASGVLSTSLATNGPPLVFVLQGRGLAPDQFRSTITTVFTICGVVSLSGRIGAGGLTHDVLVVCAWTALPMALGLLIGLKLRPLISPTGFRKLVLALLVVAALTAIRAAMVA